VTRLRSLAAGQKKVSGFTGGERVAQKGAQKKLQGVALTCWIRGVGKRKAMHRTYLGTGGGMEDHVLQLGTALEMTVHAVRQ